MAYNWAKAGATINSTSTAGAAEGSSAGPWGTLGGGVAGLITGALTAYANYKDEEEKKKILDEVAKEYNTTADEVEKLFTDYYNSDPTLSNNERIKELQSNLESYDPEKYAYKPTDFSETYTKTEDDFVDPYKDDIVQAAADSVSHSAAGAALGRGTGAARAIASKTAEVEGDLADKAWSRYMQDRSQSYAEHNGYITQMQNYLNSLNNSTQYKLNAQNNLNLELGRNEVETARQQLEDTAELKNNRTNGNITLQLSRL